MLAIHPCDEASCELLCVKVNERVAAMVQRTNIARHEEVRIGPVESVLVQDLGFEEGINVVQL